MTGVPVAAGACPPLWAATLLTVEFFVTVGLLILVLLGGAVVLHYTDLWRKRQLVPPHESAESLTSFRAMFERGEITEAEYLAVRDRVAARVKQEVALANPSTAVPSAPDTSPPGSRGPGVDSAGGANGDVPPPPDPHPK
jgi:hypothetical protein